MILSVSLRRFTFFTVAIFSMSSLRSMSWFYSSSSSACGDSSSSCSSSSSTSSVQSLAERVIEQLNDLLKRQAYKDIMQLLEKHNQIPAVADWLKKHSVPQAHIPLMFERFRYFIHSWEQGMTESAIVHQGLVDVVIALVFARADVYCCKERCVHWARGVGLASDPFALVLNNYLHRLKKRPAMPFSLIFAVVSERLKPIIDNNDDRLSKLPAPVWVFGVKESNVHRWLYFDNADTELKAFFEDKDLSPLVQEERKAMLTYTMQTLAGIAHDDAATVLADGETIGANKAWNEFFALKGPFALDDLREPTTTTATSSSTASASTGVSTTTTEVATGRQSAAGAANSSAGMPSQSGSSLADKEAAFSTAKTTAPTRRNDSAGSVAATSPTISAVAAALTASSSTAASKNKK